MKFNSNGLWITACASLASLCGQAMGQCDVRWLEGRALSGVDGGTVSAMKFVDIGGIGPRLVIGGSFEHASGTPAGYLAYWDGAEFRELGGGADNVVRTFFDWDPDGDGPSPSLVFVGGAFTSIGEVSAQGIASWNPQTGEWSALGAGVVGDVRCIGTWDPDGDDPGAPLMIVGGNFTTAGGETAHNVAAWNGVEWFPLQLGLPDVFVQDIATWDPDGPGPAERKLLIGGAYDAGPSSLGFILQWTGTGWAHMGADIRSGGSVWDIETWDPDGAGPLMDHVVVGGRIGRMGLQDVHNIVVYNGNTWSTVGDGLSGDVTDIRLHDHDANPATPDRLYTVGSFANSGNVATPLSAQWDGTQWSALFGSITSASSIQRLARGDGDGDGPLPESFLISGNFDGTIANPLNGIARWTTSGWARFGGEFTTRLDQAIAWDADPSDGVGPVLVVGGNNQVVHGVAVNNLAQLVDGAWASVGGGINSAPSALTVWDADGDGPGGQRLIVSGMQLSIAGGTTPVNRIAIYDGNAWSAMGLGLSSGAQALTAWDPDGDGPAHSLVVAGGGFTTAGGSSIARIASWDGTAWSGLGTGMPSGTIYALMNWDADGSGAGNALLIAGGSFTNAGGVSVANLAAWDGTSWSNLGGGVAGQVSSITNWDRDGSGPLLPVLVVSGQFTIAGGVPATRIAQWDGTSWSALGAGLNIGASTLRSHDPDGDGPLHSVLVAGGQFSQAGGVPRPYTAVWNGTAWSDLPGGTTDEMVDEIISYSPDADSSRPSMLAAVGRFNFAGGVRSGFWGLWETDHRPRLHRQPIDQGVDAGGAIELRTALFAFSTANTYQWYHDGVAVADGEGGASLGGGTVSGAQSHVLTITGGAFGDGGMYYLKVGNDCGEVDSAAATVVINCPADFDGTGFVDIEDFTSFVAAFEAGTDDADFDGSGFVDTDDFDAFVAAFESGC
jgi:hypothetical protein